MDSIPSASREIAFLQAPLGWVTLGLALLAALPAAARDHHVDLSATEGGSGTAAAPFASLAEAAASGALKGGDRLLLAPGNYGRVRLKGWRFSPALEIRSISGARAHMDRCERHWHGSFALNEIEF